jgi:selenium metabolism protein YedF
MVNEVVLIGSDKLGSGDDKLGIVLMSNFLRLLGQREELPKFVILWNGGVKLAARDTETVDYIKALEDKGVKVILCRTCVEYFGLEDELAAGEIDGMVPIQEILADHNVLTV